jgi:hypothetical protein
MRPPRGGGERDAGRRSTSRQQGRILPHAPVRTPRPVSSFSHDGRSPDLRVDAVSVLPGQVQIPVPVVHPKRSPLTVAGAVAELAELQSPGRTAFPFHPGHKIYASQEPSPQRLSPSGMSRQSRSERRPANWRWVAPDREQRFGASGGLKRPRPKTKYARGIRRYGSAGLQSG